jgi:hypothetical protein
MNRSVTRACTLIAAAVLALSGCTSTSPEPAEPNATATEVTDTDIDAAVPLTPGVKIIGHYNDDWYVWQIQVEGKPVTCIVWVGYKAGGPSCDFTPLRPPAW